MTAATETLTESLEHYLEAIAQLIREKRVARSKDIAQRLNVNRSSVTGALQTLRDRGLIHYERYGFVTLTEEGEEIANRIVRRHEVLRDFFVKVLGLPETEADDAACGMEHGISKQLLERLVDFAEFVETCPRAGAKWVRGFGYHCADPGMTREDCESCVAQCLDALRTVPQPGTVESLSVALTDLPTGGRGQVVKVQGGREVSRRLMDQGILVGRVVEVIAAPSDGARIEVRSRGYHISLPRGEARRVLVRRLEDGVE
ncbi:MAG: metal-dependent transcriptional regulator [Verrucomicrobiota bacterium]|nr:metal-dependent transcriptional regulator [Verrucomicrobiota bacterium]